MEDNSLFDSKRSAQLHDKMLELFKQHNVPDDQDQAVVLFVEGIMRLVRIHGPDKMSYFVALFVESWQKFSMDLLLHHVFNNQVDSIVKDMFKKANLGGE